MQHERLLVVVNAPIAILARNVWCGSVLLHEQSLSYSLSGKAFHIHYNKGNSI